MSTSTNSSTKPSTSVRQSIEEFLDLSRLAIVGVSRDEKDFTRSMFAEFVRRGYDVVPVNPNATEIAGKRCFASVRSIVPGVDGVLIMTPPAITEQVVRDCDAAGVNRVWMHRGEGIGAVNDEAVRFCEEHGISVVAGFCPYMFLAKPGFVHNMHGFIMKVSGSYPN